MKRNRYFLPLGALLAVLALGAVVMMVRANADDMLHQAARLLADAREGHAIVEVQMETPEESASATVEVWGRRDVGPEGEPAFRVEVLESSKPEAKGMIAVGDGTQVWIWKPDENTVYVGTREEMKARMAEHKEEFDHSEFDRPEFDEEDIPETPEEAVDMLLDKFTAERNGDDIVTGVDGVESAVEMLRLIPKPEEMPEEFRANGGLLNIALRKGDYAPLSVEYTGGAVGYAKATATLLELDAAIADGAGVPDTDGISDAAASSDAVFTFAIPEGAEVVNLADIEPPPPLTEEEAAKVADFAVLSPAELLSGARLESINEVRGAIVQRYRLPDGEHFTIAQGPASAGSRAGGSAPGESGEPVNVRGNEGLLFVDDDGQRSLLTWLEGEETVWIGGDLTKAEVLAVAESLE